MDLVIDAYIFVYNFANVGMKPKFMILNIEGHSIITKRLKYFYNGMNYYSGILTKHRWLNSIQKATAFALCNVYYVQIGRDSLNMLPKVEQY